MRRTPLQRRTRLRAKRWGIRPRRPRRLDKPQSDVERLAWVRTEPCVFVDWRLVFTLVDYVKGTAVAVIPGPCGGRTEACHEGRKPGLALKCPDAETMPMCSRHHRDWTDHTGVFKGWTKEQRRAWADERIAETTARYLSHGARRAG